MPWPIHVLCLQQLGHLHVITIAGVNVSYITVLLVFSYIHVCIHTIFSIDYINFVKYIHSYNL